MLVVTLTGHFDPRPSEVYNRTLSQRRDCSHQGESVSAYKAALCKLVAKCKFGTLDPRTRLYAHSTMLSFDVMLRFRFVCGLGVGVLLYRRW